MYRGAWIYRGACERKEIIAYATLTRERFSSIELAHNKAWMREDYRRCNLDQGATSSRVHSLRILGENLEVLGPTSEQGEEP